VNLNTRSCTKYYTAPPELSAYTPALAAVAAEDEIPYRIVHAVTHRVYRPDGQTTQTDRCRQLDFEIVDQNPAPGTLRYLCHFCDLLSRIQIVVDGKCPSDANRSLVLNVYDNSARSKLLEKRVENIDGNTQILCKYNDEDSNFYYKFFPTNNLFVYYLDFYSCELDVAEPRFTLTLLTSVSFNNKVYATEEVVGFYLVYMNVSYVPQNVCFKGGVREIEVDEDTTVSMQVYYKVLVEYVGINYYPIEVYYSDGACTVDVGMQRITYGPDGNHDDREYMRGLLLDGFNPPSPNPFSTHANCRFYDFIGNCVSCKQMRTAYDEENDLWIVDDGLCLNVSPVDNRITCFEDNFYVNGGFCNSEFTRLGTGDTEMMRWWISVAHHTDETCSSVKMERVIIQPRPPTNTPTTSDIPWFDGVYRFRNPGDGLNVESTPIAILMIKQEQGQDYEMYHTRSCENQYVFDLYRYFELENQPRNSFYGMILSMYKFNSAQPNPPSDANLAVISIKCQKDDDGQYYSYNLLKSSTDSDVWDVMEYVFADKYCFNLKTRRNARVSPTDVYDANFEMHYENTTLQAERLYPGSDTKVPFCHTQGFSSFESINNKDISFPTCLHCNVGYRPDSKSQCIEIPNYPNVTSNPAFFYAVFYNDNLCQDEVYSVRIQLNECVYFNRNYTTFSFTNDHVYASVRETNCTTGAQSQNTVVDLDSCTNRTVFTFIESSSQIYDFPVYNPLSNTTSSTCTSGEATKSILFLDSFRNFRIDNYDYYSFKMMIHGSSEDPKFYVIKNYPTAIPQNFYEIFNDTTTDTKML